MSDIEKVEGKMNRRILIIDDDANIRNLYSDFLSNSLSCRQDTPLTAFEVIPADHGQAGVEIFKKALENNRPFCIAFIDIRMRPGWDGLKTARAIRDFDDRIFIVIITGHHDHSIERIQDVLEHDVFYLNKPASKDEICQMARSLCLRWNRDYSEEKIKTPPEIEREHKPIDKTGPGIIRISGISDAAIELLHNETLVIRGFPFKIGRIAMADSRNRHADRQLLIEDTEPYNVSKNHLLINFYEDHYYILDNGSRLGTIVNGNFIGKKTSNYKAVLNSGDNTLIVGSESSPYRFRITVTKN